MRVTTKGQVTIPKEIRDHLGILPGSEVEMSINKDSVLMRLQAGKRGERKRRAAEVKAYLDRVRGSLDLGGVTTDEHMEWLRGPREDLGPR